MCDIPTEPNVVQEVNRKLQWKGARGKNLGYVGSVYVLTVATPLYGSRMPKLSEIPESRVPILTRSRSRRLSMAVDCSARVENLTQRSRSC
ncbi:hypothetical protein E2C01_035730 [Portunus trituberculatus]|uniref:Uncharacterized protein n=1 Tax=Portunus trituberculatus TaxID=210409 RepID=A0A5B7F9Z2_PORTR|nr:hypothetical protein [Portunus trituberculatus]